MSCEYLIDETRIGLTLNTAYSNCTNLHAQPQDGPPMKNYGIIGCGMMGNEHIANLNLLDGARVPSRMSVFFTGGGILPLRGSKRAYPSRFDCC